MISHKTCKPSNVSQASRFVLSHVQSMGTFSATTPQDLNYMSHVWFLVCYYQQAHERSWLIFLTLRVVDQWSCALFCMHDMNANYMATNDAMKRSYGSHQQWWKDGWIRTSRFWIQSVLGRDTAIHAGVSCCSTWGSAGCEEVSDEGIYLEGDEQQAEIRRRWWFYCDVKIMGRSMVW